MLTKDQYTSHDWCINGLKEAQEADHDEREQARECNLFVTKRDGQWEQFWWDANDNKPRYTFDQVSPVTDQIKGPIQRSDFVIDVSPAGGDASQDIAETYAGMIRNIQNISRAEHIFERAGCNVVDCGLDGWMIDTGFVEGDSFDQDILIKPIHGFLNRVWYGPHEEPDASDAEVGWLLTGITEEEFKQKYPDADAAGVSQDKQQNAYYHREDLVMVGEMFYLVPEPREIVLLSNGMVVGGSEAESVLDELAASGVYEVDRRTRQVKRMKRRKFSASQWLEPEKSTVFENWLTLVPVYGNFKYTDDKRTFRGAVEKLMDSQRVYNYAMSRSVEEGALSPRAKFFFTPKQVEGYEDELDSMNVSSSAYELLNSDPEAPPIQQFGGAQINPGLAKLCDDMRNDISLTAGMFAANMGDAVSGQSGEAIKALQDRGDTGSNKYLEALVFSLTHTCRILVDTIPKVYQQGRQVRIIGEDGGKDMAVIGETILDEQTQTPVVLNDLSQGAYDVTCSASTAYKNRQNETVQTMKELGASDPTIVEIGGDILAKNVASPGMDDIAERKRNQLWQAGVIPESQWTDEERQRAEQAQMQPQEPSPDMIMAQAQVEAAVAEQEKAKADQAEVALKAQESQQKFAIDQEKLRLEAVELQIKEQQLQVEAAEAGVKIDAEKAKTAETLEKARAQRLETDVAEARVAGLIAVDAADAVA